MSNLLIKSVPKETIDQFNLVKKETGKKALAAFEHLLQSYLGLKANNNSKSDPLPWADPFGDSPFRKNDSSGASGNQPEVFSTTIYGGYVRKIEELEKKNQELTQELEQYKNKPVLSELKGTQFMYEPSDSLYKKMNRVISYLIKKGKLNRNSKDLPQQMVTHSLEYTIKNKYEDILK